MHLTACIFLGLLHAAELEAFYTILVEAFQEVDVELTGIVTVEVPLLP